MTQTPQTPAGWYADPQDASQHRYWDGAAWTDHRAPRTSGGVTSQQVAQTGADIADGIATAFTSFGNWVQKNTSTAPPGQPTFQSVAASCRDEPARQPLSRSIQLTLSGTDLEGVRALCTATGTVITPAGVELPNEVCRLVPNPWDPQNPTGVAVFVGAIMIGTLPPDVAPEYSPALTQLTQKQLVATGTARVWAEGQGVPSRAGVTVTIPEASAFA